MTNKTLKTIGVIAAARAALHIVSGGSLGTLLSVNAWMPGAVMSDVTRLTAPRAAVASNTSAIEVQLKTSSFEVPTHWQGNAAFLNGFSRRG